MDMIIANQVGDGKGMGSDVNQVTVLGVGLAEPIKLPEMTKSSLARKLIALIADQYGNRSHHVN
jgi:phosphopantothenoylcysteine decarboxylase/phosphopantothenate--cysteine ligase